MTVFRVLRTAKATLSRTFYLDEAATPATGAVTVVVTRLDGTIVQSVPATGPDADQAYSFTYDGSDTLDEVTVTWSATVGGDAIVLDQDVIEVVGGFYIGLGEIRGIDPKFRGTQGLTQFPTADLIERRIEVEDEFERICEQAFVPRFCRETLSGNGARALVLRWPHLRRVLSVSVDGTAFDVDTTSGFGVDNLGLLRRDRLWTLGAGNVVVEYEHGLDRAPTDIRRVAKIRLKSLLLTSQSPLPDRAERIATTEIGLVQLAVASRDKTGIPEVDAVLDRHPSPRPGF